MTADLAHLAVLGDRYRIERELGQGGMATVYLAEDLRHHRKVAIKVLCPELAQSLGAERFLREIETTANLRHPHILPLYDSGAVHARRPDSGPRAEREAGEGSSLLFYVMPVVEGESLRDRLNREKQLPIDEALAITREVADACESWATWTAAMRCGTGPSTRGTRTRSTRCGRTRRSTRSTGSRGSRSSWRGQASRGTRPQ